MVRVRPKDANREAMFWGGGLKEAYDVIGWVGQRAKIGNSSADSSRGITSIHDFRIETHTQSIKVYPGMWVIKVNATESDSLEFQVMHSHIFEELYESVD